MLFRNLGMLLVCLSLCACRKTPPKANAKHRKQAVQRTVTQKLPPYMSFKNASEAMTYLLKRPHSVLGIGEYHQQHRFKHISPAIERFRKQMLPQLGGEISDLLVETWVTTGQCGKQEKVVVKEVKKVIKRPKKTTNHIIELLKAGKRMKMAPHILRAHCKDYESLQDETKTGFDPVKMLRFVTDKLGQTTTWILKERKKRKQKAAIAIYGGAIHNDIKPSETLRPFSYVHTLPAKAQKKFIELDLYVPEYIYEDAHYKKVAWYPLLNKAKETNKVILIQHTSRSFSLIFKWTPTSKK